jgi:hypothetical protein
MDVDKCKIILKSKFQDHHNHFPYHNEDMFFGFGIVLFHNFDMSEVSQNN